MTPDLPTAGETLPLSRRLTVYPDPVALFASLCEEGTRAHSLLFESADATTKQTKRSFLLTRCALQATCRGRRVRVRALSDGGMATLGWLGDRLLASGAASVAWDDADLVVEPWFQGDATPATVDPGEAGLDTLELQCPRQIELARNDTGGVNREIQHAAPTLLELEVIDQERGSGSERDLLQLERQVHRQGAICQRAKATFERQIALRAGDRDPAGQFDGRRLFAGEPVQVKGNRVETNVQRCSSALVHKPHASVLELDAQSCFRTSRPTRH